MKISSDLIFNFLLDNKKKEINPVTRAHLIQQYLDDNKMSQRELAKQLGMSHSTMQDWIMWQKISEKDYLQFKARQLTHTEIYRKLRDNKKRTKKEIIEGILFEFLDESVSHLKPLIKFASKQEEIDKARELIDICNRIIMYANKKRGMI